jgi:hypothetical protein
VILSVGKLIGSTSRRAGRVAKKTADLVVFTLTAGRDQIKDTATSVDDIVDRVANTVAGRAGKSLKNAGGGKGRENREREHNASVFGIALSNRQLLETYGYGFTQWLKELRKPLVDGDDNHPAWWDNTHEECRQAKTTIKVEFAKWLRKDDPPILTKQYGASAPPLFADEPEGPYKRDQAAQLCEKTEFVDLLWYFYHSDMIQHQEDVKKYGRIIEAAKNIWNWEHPEAFAGEIVFGAVPLANNDHACKHCKRFPIAYGAPNCCECCAWLWHAKNPKPGQTLPRTKYQDKPMKMLTPNGDEAWCG